MLISFRVAAAAHFVILHCSFQIMFLFSCICSHRVSVQLHCECTGKSNNVSYMLIQ